MYKVLSILALFTLQVTSMFHKDIGVNDWSKEHLGDLKDLKFIDDSQLVYTLSYSGVLTLFDTYKQKIQWRKDLPEKEDYELRLLGRNLMVYSEQRAMLINSQAHILYDFQFGGETQKDKAYTAVDMFEHEGQIITCFAKDHSITVYDGYQEIAKMDYLEIVNGQEIQSPTFKPLQFLYSTEFKSLRLLAYHDHKLKVLEIDFSKSEIKELDSKPFTIEEGKKIKSLRSKSQILIWNSNGEVDVYKLHNFKKLRTIENVQEIQVSPSNEYALIKDNLKKYIIHLKSGSEQQYTQQCHFLMATQGDAGIGGYSVEQCGDTLTFRSAQNQGDQYYSMEYKLSKGSKVKTAFVKQLESKELEIILQFEDLSLHMIDKEFSTRWIREESLSEVQQVEIMESEDLMIEHELSYVQNVKDDSRLDQVPMKIIRRYSENLQYVVKLVLGLINQEKDAQKVKTHTLFDEFGFNKVFIVRTKPGSVIAISSLNGNIIWKQNFDKQNAPLKVFVRNEISRVDSTISKQIVVVGMKAVSYLNPFTGFIEKSESLDHNEKSEYLMVHLTESKTQFVIQIQEQSLSNGAKLKSYPSDLQFQELLKKEKIYFTYINKKDGIVSGYQLLPDLSTISIWNMNIEQMGESYFKIVTQFQTDSLIEHLHFQPTSFSDENIIFKYIDSNMFALGTVNQQDDLVIYLINGVSGKVVYKFFEKKVRLDKDIDFHFSENIFIMSFSRSSPSGLAQQEVSVTELFSQRQEDNTKKLLIDYYKGEERLHTSSFSSFFSEQPIVVQENYLLPITIKKITLTQTQHHITGKNLVVVSTSNQVYSIDNMFISARRPHGENMVLSQDPDKEETKEVKLKSADYPPYDAVIPHMTTKYLSYELQLLSLKDVLSFPSRLESTSQIFAYGFDMFFVRVSPENNFDLLQENFNYTLLFLVIMGLFIGLMVVKKYVSMGNSKNSFLLM